MRATTIGKRLPYAHSCVTNTSFDSSPFLSSSFSVSSSSGSSGSRGRGRGHIGRVIPSFPERCDFTAKDQDSKNLDDEKPDVFSESRLDGIGRGRGRLHPNRFLPDLSLFGSSQSGIGRGREIGKALPDSLLDPKSDVASLQPKIDSAGVPTLPESILSAYSGTGRGKSGKSDGSISQIKEENRHIGARINLRHEPRGIPPASSVQLHPKLNREEAVKKAISLLSRGRDSGGQGKGRGRGRGRGRWDGRENRANKDSDKMYVTGLFLGDNADGERLANRIGAENMDKLIGGFEEMSDRVVPCPWKETFIDALDTNYMFEFEPEYLMGEIDQNPDIDEKPPLPIRDMLEKVKPFIVAYEGIQSQQEWEDAVENTLKNAPLMKEIVEQYAGPERVTAKKQEEELQRLVETVPASVNLSFKQFANRAYLSLKSNPGWGFDKKYQFMDKLVRQVSIP